MSRYALPLTGYENYSVWGHDSQDLTYFAQLWRNDSDGDDEPDIWLNWSTGKREIDSPLALAELISARTGIATAEVVRAMAAAPTAPEAPILRDLADLLATPVL